MRTLWTGSMLAVSLFLAACGGGGGGTVSTVPEAVVQTVGIGQVLEGDAGTTQLEFLVTLDKPVVRGLDVIFSTASTAKTGVVSTGSAIGGSACSVANTDFVSVTNGRISIAPGAAMGRVIVSVCADATFEPTETLRISWQSSGTAGGTVVGTVVNDDVGGLNGTGTTTVMGGGAAYGRDTNALTNSASDGALGFSFEKRASDGVAAAIDNSDWNCTFDKVSGLTWQRVPAVTRDFASLAAYAATVNGAAPCGYNDWRVPTVNELLTLMDASSSTGNAPNADRSGALDAMTGKFWSSESLSAVGAVDAWLVDTDQGAAVSYVAKTDTLGVRLVRGGATALVCDNADTRFTDLLDGTVSDVKTGLLWKKCAEGYSDTACTVGPATAFDSASTVIDRLNAANVALSSTGLGYTDWRIPTKSELASLANRTCTGNLAVVASVFPNNESVSYISATADANNASRFWYVDFSGGTVAVGPVTQKRLRLVRAGQ